MQTAPNIKTERVVVKLKELHPNPFKKHIQDGKLDDEKISRLEESIGQTGFWDGLAARRNGDGFQVAFGHHRLQAAINRLGKDYRTGILVAEYTDEQMALMMVNENSTSEGASFAEQSDAVVFAQDFLKAHPTACKSAVIHSESAQKSPKARDGQHQHGSERCIVAWLGKENWSQPKVHRLLDEAGLLDKSIIEDRNKTGSRTAAKGRVGHGTAGKLGKLAKPMQAAFVKAIKQAKVGLPADLINEAIDTAVEHVGKDASTEQQEKAANAAIQAAAAQQLKDNALRRSKEIDDWLQLMTNDLMGFVLPDEEKLLQVIGLREHSKNRATLRGTVSALRRLAKRLEKYADQLEAPPQKKLN